MMCTMAVRMHSKETMIDTRPGTSTVGIQCSIWEQPPEQVLPSIPLNKATEVQSSSRSSSAVGGEIVLQCRNVHQNDQLVKQCNTNLNLDQGLDGVVESEITTQGEASTSSQDKIPFIDEASYSLMVDVLWGRFNIPVKDRTKQHKSAIVRLWRNRGKFTVNNSNPENLYYNGKCVPRRSQQRDFTSKGSEGKNRGRGRPLKRTHGAKFVTLAGRNFGEDLRQDQRDDSIQLFSDTSQSSHRGRNNEAQSSPRKQPKESSPINDASKFPALDEASYSLMVDILKGQFKIPTENRTRQQKSVIIKLWKAKGKYTVDDCDPANLYYNGKCVLRKEQLVTDNQGPIT